ncbi:MAG TPA: type 1 glutamine amidotransferase domain-containing protein [Polyangia bacterium]
MSEKRLQGLRVAVLAVDGFEQVEVTIPMRALRREGADVRIVSLRPGRIRGMNFLFRGKKLPVDDLVSRAQPEEYGALLLPGGFVNPDLLRQSKQARDFVRQFDAMERPIATLCHGPEVLISAGLVKGRRLTSWPGIADDIRNAGGTWEDSAAVRDRNWVASRSPLDMIPFCQAMIDLFDEAGVRDLAPAPRRVRYVARLTHVATLAAMATAVVAGRAAFRSVGPKRLSIGLLSGAALVAAGARIFAPRARNTRQMGLAPDVRERRAAA